MNNDIDTEMNSFLKEHFIQGTIVATDSLRTMIVKMYEHNQDKVEKLPEDFVKGWNAAFKTIVENIDKVIETLPKNELTDEEHFDKLLVKFKKAFPKQD